MQKTNHLAPITTVFINTQLGKSTYEKIRILLNSGSSGFIIVEQFVRKLRLTNDTKTSWSTKGGNFQTSKKCKTTLILNELYENKSIEWNLYVDSTAGPHCYDMILGHDILSELGISLDFKEQMMMWEDSMVHMKDPNSLQDLMSSVLDFYWSDDLYEMEALLEATTCLKKFST